MSSLIEEVSSVDGEAWNAEATAAGTSRDAKGSEDTGSGSSTGAKPKERKEAKGKAKYIVEKVSVATQVDVRAWVTDMDILKENSREQFWRKVAEKNQAVLTELRDHNVTLHATIDNLTRENEAYQEVLDEYYHYRGTFNIFLPGTEPLVFVGEEEVNCGCAPPNN